MGPRNKSYWLAEDDEQDRVGHDNDNEDEDEDVDEDEDMAAASTKKKKQYLVLCPANHPDKRKQYKPRGSRKWINVTPGYLLCLFGALLIGGAMQIQKLYTLWNQHW